MTGRRLIGVAVVAVVVAAGVAIWLSSRSSSSSDWRSEQAEWELGGQPHGTEIRLGVGTGYCDGAPEPRLKTEVTETENRVSILATVEEFIVEGPCAGLGIGLVETVTLAEPLVDRTLFDAGADPPAQRWPRQSN